MMNEENKNILKKSSKLSFFILINKPIGLIRDILQTRYFGIGILSDAYVIAWKIPNIFRRIFGEGLLNNILLPDLVKIQNKESKETLNKTITLISIIMQFIITIICIIISYYSTNIITYLSPGALERISYAASLLKILSFFTFFMSLSSILGVSVQLHNNFYVGPQSQFILNIFFSIELFLAQKYHWEAINLSILIVCNGLIILLVHLITFFYYNFYFSFPNKQSIKYTYQFFKKFFIALISNILLESNIFLGISISSYLKPGLISLFELLLTLIRIPQQILGSSVASTMNIQMIEIIQNNPNQLSEKLFSIFKLFLILSLAIVFCIYTFSELFFKIFFYFTNIDIQYINLASNLLMIMSLSIFPALANKILLNIYYAYEKIVLSTIITFLTTILYNLFIYYFINKYQLYAFAIGYFLSDWIRFFIFNIILYIKYNFNILYEINKYIIFFTIIKYLIMTILFLIIKKILYNILIIEFLFKKEFIIIVNSLIIYLFYRIINKKYNIE